MNIAVFGGTGMVGSRIVSEAASRGHLVSSVSRNPESWELDGVTPVGADVTDPATVTRMADEHDVVVSAIGPSREPDSEPGAFLDAVQTFIDNVGSTRLFVVGGAGSLLVGPGQPLSEAPGFPAARLSEARIQGAALERLRRTGGDVDWTYRSPPPMIAPGQRTGSYVLGDDSPAGRSISAEDFAVAVLDELETPAHRQVRFTVAN